MKLILLFFLVSLSLFAQTTPAKNIQVGTYSCAARMLGPTTFQHWCYKDGKINHNAVMEIMTPSVESTYSDSTGTPTMQILWVVTLPGTYSVSFVVGTNAPVTMTGTF